MVLREFRNLRRKRDPALGFSDLLNYAALVDSGVILLKDGSLLAGWRYAGPDLNSAGAEELTALSHQVNSALAGLGDGWAMNVDLIRHASAGYPEPGAFPDPVTALIDEERRRHYTAEGRHFESELALTLTWTPPTEMQSRAARFLFESAARSTNWERTLEFFKTSLAEYEDALSARLALVRMDDAALLAHLNACITGGREPIRPPEDGSYVDVLLGCHEFHAGFRPMLDDLHIRPISIAGFPLASWPEVTAFLDELALRYRWSTRFIFLDPSEAERALKIERRNWFQKRHGLGGMIKQVFSNGTAQTFENRDAVAMAHDADEALADIKARISKGDFVASKLIPMFREVAEDWFRSKADRRPGTVGNWRAQIDLHLNPRLGDLRLDRIDVALIEKVRDELRSKLSPKSVNAVLTTAAAIFKLAARRKLVNGNPAADAERAFIGAIELKDEATKQGREDGVQPLRPEEVLDPNEIRKLLEKAEPGFYRTLFLTAYLTGMRSGELFSMRWSDIELKGIDTETGKESSRGRILVRRSLS